MIFSKVVQV